MKLKNTLYALLAVLILIASSKIELNTNLEFLSFSLQSLVVILLAHFLYLHIALIVVLIYVAAGLIGLPVFSSADPGILALNSSSIGYLLGFFLAVIISHGKTHAFVKFIAAHFAILLCGSIGLILVKDLSLNAAMKNGLLVFIPAAIVKSLIAFLIVRAKAFFASQS